MRQNFLKLFAGVGASLLILILLLPANLTVAAVDTVGIKVVIKLKDNANSSALFTKYNIREPEQIFDLQTLGNIYTGYVNQSIIRQLQIDEGLDFVILDHEVQAAAITDTQQILTNDPYFTNATNQENQQWFLPKTRVPDAWDYTKGSAAVRVAIIDTGIHASHLDLDDGRVVAGFNVLTNQTIAANTNSDDNGHGTAIAGVIGAIPNNNLGVAGINWQISLVPVKALNANGSGEISAIAQGITWAADHDIDIINMSLGGGGYAEDPLLASAVNYAYKKGVLIVAAAGNDQAEVGLNLDKTPVYPICADNGENMVLGVAATDINDVKATFSNFGINCVDITAPGKRILMTGFLPSNPGDNILIYGSGTSLATPIVSGIAALVKAVYPNYTNAQIREAILKNADNIDEVNTSNCLNTSCNGFLGKGRINALAAVAPKPFIDGSLVRDLISNKIYFVTGKAKQFVSDFIFTQRGFNPAHVIDDTRNQLAMFDDRGDLSPLEDTLIKSQSDPTVYIIKDQLKRPLTYLVFTSRRLSFTNVRTLSDADVARIKVGEWYWPPDRTLVLVQGDPTVFVMDQQVARPTTFFVFTQRKLSFANVITVTADEFSHVPRPFDKYWLAPPDGTLVKSSLNSAVYVIENGQKRPLTSASFAIRKYKFSSINILPPVEIDVIASGIPIL